MSYDTHCDDLARLFLADTDVDGVRLSREAIERYAPDFAQHIQDAIEAWLGYDLAEHVRLDADVARIIESAREKAASASSPQE